MTGVFSVKLKSKNGQFVVRDLLPNTTIADLKAKISQVTQIKEPQLHVLIGFPPRPFDLSKNSKDLATSGITSGETLIVEEKPNGSTVAPSCLQSIAMGPNIDDDEALARRLQAEENEQAVLSAAKEDGSSMSEAARISVAAGPSDNYNGVLLKKVVPADNSCLFTSVRFVLNGKIDNEGSEIMRHIIAQEVAADPENYNDAVLGKSNAEYCTWIQRPESWGGAIEVSILSSYYGIEIDVVDIQNAIINRFGEDKNYGVRVFLLFDGIHYDPIYLETADGGQAKTIFPVEELGVFHQAEQLAEEAKSSRQFTNVDKFTLRCIQCDKRLVGQVQAQQHAKATGHTNFGEI